MRLCSNSASEPCSRHLLLDPLSCKYAWLLTKFTAGRSVLSFLCVCLSRNAANGIRCLFKVRTGPSASPQLLVVSAPLDPVAASCCVSQCVCSTTWIAAIDIHHTWKRNRFRRETTCRVFRGCTYIILRLGITFSVPGADFPSVKERDSKYSTVHDCKV